MTILDGDDHEIGDALISSAILRTANHPPRSAGVGAPVEVSAPGDDSRAATACGRATAAPADTALPVPVVGITTLPTGFPSLVYTQVTVRTDPERRGITEFVGYCSCTVHWRNMSTGVGGTMVPAVKPTPVVTGSGALVAAMTVDGRSGVVAQRVGAADRGGGSGCT